MSRLSDIEAELEALRMMVSDLQAALDANPREPVDEDADRKRPNKEEIKAEQDAAVQVEALKEQEEKLEESAFDKFKNGPSALKDFAEETIIRRKELDDFFEGRTLDRLDEVLLNDPAALEEDVVIGPTHPNIINQIVREPVKFDLGTPKKEELRTNAQPGFITLKAEDSDGDYYTYEVLGLKTGNALTDPSVYVHPTHTARSITTSGAEILGSFSSNNLGHVTGITKRTLTLSDLGYSAYTLPVASDTVLGGLKTGFSPQSDDNKYALDLDDSSNKAFITLGSATANKIGGIKIGHGTSHPKYEVLLDASAGKAYVNVPWTDTQLTTEAVQDIVGAMVASNTESGITVTYEDGDGTLDFVVASQTDENFTTADHAALDAAVSKLSYIEAGATADQTAAEIRTLVGSATDSNVYTDAHKNYVQSLIDGGSP